MKILKLFIAFLLFCSMKSFAEERTILLTSAEYPPYYGETLLNRGPVTEIIIEAYKKAGYEVIVDFYPWVRAETLAEYGRYDGMFPPWLTEKRKGYFAFSDPLFPNEIGFLARKELNISYKTYDDLQEYTIGICRGYANPEGFDTTVLRVEEVTTDLQNITKLINGRIHLVLTDKILAEYIIRTQFPRYMNDFEWLEPSCEKKMQYLCISKKADDWQRKINAFNRGLKLLRESGEYNKILLKHGISL